ncbi:MAG: hypothetical protein U0514_00440 [Candidatus Andersenbacteria bacterium]
MSEPTAQPRLSPLPALTILALVGALSFGDWLTTTYQLKFKHLGQWAAADIVAANDVFRTLRSYAATLNPAGHPGPSTRVIYVSDPSVGHTPTEIETFYIFYPEIPTRKDVRDKDFAAYVRALPAGTTLVSEPPLTLPRHAETIDGHGLFIYVLR